MQCKNGNEFKGNRRLAFITEIVTGIDDSPLLRKSTTRLYYGNRRPLLRKSTTRIYYGNRRLVFINSRLPLPDENKILALPDRKTPNSVQVIRPQFNPVKIK
jgi:hypothetical protein